MQMQSVVLTNEQRVNLDKLALYLEGLPKDYKDFQMSEYFAVSGPKGYTERKLIETEYALKNGGVGKCGAVACAIGHGPSAGILFKASEFREDNGLYIASWELYCENFCGNASNEWRWMFGGNWSIWDNTPAGAAARIRYTLRHHEVPDMLADDTKMAHCLKLYEGEF